MIDPEEVIAPESVITPVESASRASSPEPVIGLETVNADVAVERNVLPSAGNVIVPVARDHAEALFECVTEVNVCAPEKLKAPLPVLFNSNPPVFETAPESVIPPPLLIFTVSLPVP